MCYNIFSYPGHLHAITGDALVSGRALDKKTGEPIKDSLVYMGTGRDELKTTI